MARKRLFKKPKGKFCITEICRVKRTLSNYKNSHNNLKAKYNYLENIHNKLSASYIDSQNRVQKQSKLTYDTAQEANISNINNNSSIANNNQVVAAALSASITPPNRIAYDDIVKENQLLTNKKNSIKDVYQSGDQKSYYESKQVNYLLTINSALFWFYYIILILFTYVIFYINESMSKYLKIAILLLCISYPFIINPVEIFLYQVYKITMAFINVNAYTNNY